jgi:Flp pilus assembly protein TadD
MADNELVFTLGWTDVDPALLPADSRELGTDGFRLAVTRVLQGAYESLGGKARIIFDDASRTLTVYWAKHGTFASVEQRATEALKQGDTSIAVPLLKAIIAKTPGDATALYNLGMIYSDQRRLDQAVELLRQAAEIDPQNPHIFVAMGVAHARAEDFGAAIQSLHQAVQIDPDDTFAHQNLGACLLKQGDADEAAVHFRKSLSAAPDNLQSQFGLAQALEIMGRMHDADEVYQALIRVAGHSPVGELAKEGRTRIAHVLMRQRGEQRPDVLMYCLGALERFADMTTEQIQNVGHEIAILGMRGLDINDPAKKYALKSLPGDFSGLHLVSIMYVAFQHFAPGTDVGIDLSNEYALAKEMFEAGQ